jgi:hypothetical protein
MKINWTPEPAHVVRPPHPHDKIAWTLWVVSIACVCLWIAGMAAGISFGGKIHLLLLIFAGLMLVCVVLGFKFVQYLEPMKLARRWLLSLRAQRAEDRHNSHE